MSQDDKVKDLQELTGWPTERCLEFLNSKVLYKKVQIDSRMLREALDRMAPLTLLQGEKVELTVVVPIPWADQLNQELQNLALDHGRGFYSGPGKGDSEDSLH